VAEPPAGAQGEEPTVWGQAEAEYLFVVACPKEAANLPRY